MSLSLSFCVRCIRSIDRNNEVVRVESRSRAAGVQNRDESVEKEREGKEGGEIERRALLHAILL